MLEFQEKIKLKRYLYSRLVLVVLLIIIAFLLNAVWSVYQKQAYTKENLNKTASSLNDLRAREKMLSSELDKLKTESGTEEEIREKYGLVKPNEEVIMMVDQKGATSTERTTADVGFWQSIVNRFNP